MEKHIDRVLQGVNMEDLTIGEFFELIKKIKMRELLELSDSIPFREILEFLMGIDEFFEMLGYIIFILLSIKIVYHIWLISSIGKMKRDLNFLKTNMYLHPGNNTANIVSTLKYTGWKIIIAIIVGYFVLHSINEIIYFYPTMFFIGIIVLVIIVILLLLVIKRLKNNENKNTFQFIIEEIKAMIKSKEKE